jgi:hypothetical protein
MGLREPHSFKLAEGPGRPRSQRRLSGALKDAINIASIAVITAAFGRFLPLPQGVMAMEQKTDKRTGIETSQPLPISDGIAETPKGPVRGRGALDDFNSNRFFAYLDSNFVAERNRAFRPEEGSPFVVNRAVWKRDNQQVMANCPYDVVTLSDSTRPLQQYGEDYIVNGLNGWAIRIPNNCSIPAFVDSLEAIGMAFTHPWVEDTTAAGKPHAVAANFSLEQNYPNPFNAVTNIRFSLQKDCAVRLSVFDVNGREVAVLMDGREHAGTINIRFDANSLASGTYFCKLEADGQVQTSKMVLLK